MAKHLENKNDIANAKIITRQGERLIVLERKVEELQKKLVQERQDRIEDLNDIYYLATCNSYGNEKVFLHKISEVIGEKLFTLTNGIIKKPKIKELRYTDQSNK